jgi:SAM-dependent methyltransferase
LEADECQCNQIRTNLPSATVLQHDITQAFPREALGAGVAVAGLSLHYFSSAETKLVMQNIHDALVPNGLLVGRVNADDDFNFGARGSTPLEPELFLVDGKLKRFFSAERLMHYLSIFHDIKIRRCITMKYGEEKRVLEFSCRSDAKPFVAFG